MTSLSLERFVSSRHYTLRVVQIATWSLWIFGVLSVALFGGLLARLGMQGMSVLSVSHALQEARSEQGGLERDLADIRSSPVRSGGSRAQTVAAVAAELERSARALGVSLLSFSPDDSEIDLPDDQSPGEGFVATGQKVLVRAKGPYRPLMDWLRSVATGNMPVKVETVTLSPSRVGRNASSVTVDVALSFYRVRKK
ncbi:MAG: hypothetical protein IT209_08535 [Armatimonadetes bacterium]|nr:hypothetical protein [Armatimonadota bacterium]